MDFQEVVRRRRSVRRYDLSRPVPPEVTDRILRNALKAPSAGFSQGWIGYPAEPARPITKGRKPVDEVLYRHRWGSPAEMG